MDQRMELLKYDHKKQENVSPNKMKINKKKKKKNALPLQSPHSICSFPLINMCSHVYKLIWHVYNQFSK